MGSGWFNRIQTYLRISNEKECETKTQKQVVKTELAQKTQKQEPATQVRAEQFQIQAANVMKVCLDTRVR